MTFSSSPIPSEFEMKDFDFDFHEVVFCGVGHVGPPVDSESGEDLHGDTADEAPNWMFPQVL